MFQLSAKSSCIAYVVYASMNLSTTKLTPFNDEGNPVKHFQNPQKPNKKSYGAFKIWRQKNSKKFKLTSGAPYARCATSNRKKLVSKKI